MSELMVERLPPLVERVETTALRHPGLVERLHPVVELVETTAE
jgi:hypothetical protein